MYKMKKQQRLYHRLESRTNKIKHPELLLLLVNITNRKVIG